MIPNFAGQRVTTVSVDYIMRLFTDRGWQFDLECDVEIQSAGHDVARIDKDGPGTPVPEVLESISGQEIRHARVSESGDLDVTLESVAVVAKARGQV